MIFINKIKIIRYSIQNIFRILSLIYVLYPLTPFYGIFLFCYNFFATWIYNLSYNSINLKNSAHFNLVKPYNFKNLRVLFQFYAMRLIIGNHWFCIYLHSTNQIFSNPLSSNYLLMSLNLML